MAEYKNPQQEPGSEKRLLLIFLVTFVVMLLAQPLLKKYFPTPAAPQNQPAQAQPAPAATNTPPVKTPAVVTPATGVTKQAAAETETVIENDLYRITFTNRGAEVKSWILKKYDNDAKNGPLDLVNQAGSAIWASAVVVGLRRRPARPSGLRVIRELRRRPAKCANQRYF